MRPILGERNATTLSRKVATAAAYLPRTTEHTFVTQAVVTKVLNAEVCRSLQETGGFVRQHMQILAHPIDITSMRGSEMSFEKAKLLVPGIPHIVIILNSVIALHSDYTCLGLEQRAAYAAITL